MTSVLVLLETRNGGVRPSSLEVLGAAREILDSSSGTVHALVIEETEINPARLGAAGADQVHACNAEGHSPDGSASTTAALAKSLGVSTVLLAATIRGRDLLGRIAAKLDSGFAADCTEVKLSDASLECVRPIYAGKALLQVRIPGTIAVASLRPNHFAAANRDYEAELNETDTEPGVAQVKGMCAGGGNRPDVAEASIVVSGGRGLEAPENWHIIEDLADALPGAALGASRAVVDAGWRPHSEQVGQTGKTVSPELYFAIGISGAIQHLAGMSSSKVIVAINKDPDAPIFAHATYGIVGEADEVVPALTAELRKVLE